MKFTIEEIKPGSDWSVPFPDPTCLLVGDPMQTLAGSDACIELMRVIAESDDSTATGVYKVYDEGKLIMLVRMALCSEIGEVRTTGTDKFAGVFRIESPWAAIMAGDIVETYTKWDPERVPDGYFNVRLTAKSLRFVEGKLTWRDWSLFPECEEDDIPVWGDLTLVDENGNQVLHVRLTD